MRSGRTSSCCTYELTLQNRTGRVARAVMLAAASRAREGPALVRPVVTFSDASPNPSATRRARQLIDNTLERYLSVRGASHGLQITTVLQITTRRTVARAISDLTCAIVCCCFISICMLLFSLRPRVRSPAFVASRGEREHRLAAQCPTHRRTAHLPASDGLHAGRQHHKLHNHYGMRSSSCKQGCDCACYCAGRLGF